MNIFAVTKNFDVCELFIFSLKNKNKPTATRLFTQLWLELPL